MSREPEELELEGNIKIVSQPLKYEKAEDLLPDMMAIGALVFQNASAALEALGTGSLRKLNVDSLTGALGGLLAGFAERLKAGELKRLAPLILNCTSVIYPDANGQLVNRDLSMKAGREAAFEEHPELYFITLGFAAKVTFAKYFPAIGPLAAKVKSLLKSSLMMVPSQQTKVTEVSPS